MAFTVIAGAASGRTVQPAVVASGVIAGAASGRAVQPAVVPSA